MMDDYAELLEAMQGTQARSQAMADALRRQKAAGQLGVLTGDKVLGDFGRTLLAERPEDSSNLRGIALAQGQQRLKLQEAAEARKAAQRDKELALKAKAAEGKGADKADRAEEGLRKELMNNPIAKAFNEATVAFDKVQRAAQAPSAANDLALIFGYMKTLDPGSTVREGEFASAQNAGGIDARVSAMYNRVLRGERLTEAQRADFVRSATAQYAAQKALYDRLATGYRGLADAHGVAPERVALPLGLDLGAPAAPAPAAAAPAAPPSQAVQRAASRLQTNQPAPETPAPAATSPGRPTPLDDAKRAVKTVYSKDGKWVREVYEDGTTGVGPASRRPR